ncbi:lipoyl(octanoyl) transferase LipB [Conexibacter sp. SYSU D00693]|uniref:lipoyl(octanoyl) transferase LipB n=1 Tax=Conexibacter sp. SYSU D00693 TaxID=2812560 RepID=UPI00196A38C2|nr:lipoyl(octanoyl) transferase LipB [Conexibacter sp. SYSU D00693]
MAELWVADLGLVPYDEALALQRAVRAARQAERVPDVLLLLQHPPVYTRGRRTDPAELPLGEAWYRERGIDVVDVDRGGKVTFHGPGQLVGYPIARVTDVLGFVGLLEDAMVAALEQEGLAARGRAAEGRDWTGVWVQDRKIGSIGLHVSHGVTTHGFSLNADLDLEPFSWVVPCGLSTPMTSLSAERGGGPVDLRCLRKRVAHEVAGRLGVKQRLVTRARLERAIALEDDRAPVVHEDAVVQVAGDGAR